MAHNAHILLISHPAQGHINPTLQFAKRLIRLGAKVTYVTTVFAQYLFSQTSGTIEGLTIAAFSDGHDDGFKSKSVDETNFYVSELRKRSSQKLKEIITTSGGEGHPVTCVVYSLFYHWAGEVAKSYGIPFAYLWIQPATVLNIYYQYFSGYEDEIRETANNPFGCIDLPGLPKLASFDLPSFFLPTSPPEYSSILQSFKEQFLALDIETNPIILVNTFDKLEPEALKSIEKYKLVGIGPLIPSAFLDQKDISDRSFGGDLLQKSMDYIEWLNKKPESSVIYVSFGSMFEFPKEQMKELAYGLLDSDRPFLWVIREKGEEKKEEDVYTISSMDALRQKGMIVPWCSQLEVLSHSSLGCFVTHCGWNSTMESLVLGVPVVAFPGWSDQSTNAKLIEDVWKTGVRMRTGESAHYHNDIVDRKEIKRCIDMVMGDEERRKELRINALKWKDLAREAVMEGGTSDDNLKAFVMEIGGAD